MRREQSTMVLTADTTGTVQDMKPARHEATMTLPRPADDAAGVEITSSEAWDRFDDVSQEFLGITGSEFIYRLEAGSLDLDDPQVSIVRGMLPVEYEAGR